MRKLIAILLLAAPVWAQNAEEAAKKRAAAIHQNYAKYEWRIPMRDGVRLHTTAYVPNGVNFGKSYPILMMRTPYSCSPYGLDRYAGEIGATEDFEKEGFIFVTQDVRGRWRSEGEFVNMRPAAQAVNEATDTYDTIDWLVKHAPHNNGRVGMWGISYPGFYTAYGSINSHPALKAVSPQAPIADWWKGDDMHRNGAFNLHLGYYFFSHFGKPQQVPTDVPAEPFKFGTVDPYQFFLDMGTHRKLIEAFGFENKFWNEMARHPNYDEFWQSRNLLPHLRGITSAMMVVGGWYDTEDLYGPLNIYQVARQNNPGARVSLVMGPWAHGYWIRNEGRELGDVDFGARTADTFGDLMLGYFKHHLKGADDPKLPGAFVFETGANRWRSFGSWPPAAARPVKFFLNSSGSLARQAAGDGYDEFLSDPAKPVPYTDDFTSIRQSKNYMAEDQRFAARRPDVLVYQSAPLTEPVTVAGPLVADLYVSTSLDDADWVVKLVDVNPGKLGDRESWVKGHQQTLVRGEPMRGRFRDDPQHPKPFVPGQKTHVRFKLNDVFHTFQRGHRIMVHVQSSMFPYVDRNPQKWVANIFEADEDDYGKAVHRVYRGSSLELPILSGPDQTL